MKILGHSESEKVIKNKLIDLVIQRLKKSVSRFLFCTIMH